MDISVSSNGEAGERGGTGSEPAAPPEPSPANRGPQRSRTATSLPSGPDPAVVFRYVKWGGIAVIGLLALLVVWSVFSGGSRTPARTAQPEAAPAARTPSMTFFALRTVQVRVTRVNADKTDGEVVFAQTLAAGETRTIPRTSALFVQATPPDGLEIDLNGKRVNWGQALSAHAPGWDKGEIPAP
jgi:hypothetical protein